MNNKDDMFEVKAEDFDQLYDLAEVVIATKSAVNKAGNEVKLPETLAALALQNQIDEAKRNGTESLFFTENEVQFLSSVVS